jgi:large conductance mechanosensitive channel
MALRWFREFTDFFFQKGNALNLAIAVVVGTQFQQSVDALTQDLLMADILIVMVVGGMGAPLCGRGSGDEGAARFFDCGLGFCL